MTLRRVATLRPAVREDVGDLKTRQAIDEGVHSIPSFCSLITVRKSILQPTKDCRSAGIPTAASKPSRSSAPVRWRITTRAATRA
jgi:hypothetical protein